jgi:hypothetical protein
MDLSYFCLLYFLLAFLLYDLKRICSWTWWLPTLVLLKIQWMTPQTINGPHLPNAEHLPLLEWSVWACWQQMLFSTTVTGWGLANMYFCTASAWANRLNTAYLTYMSLFSCYMGWGFFEGLNLFLNMKDFPIEDWTLSIFFLIDIQAKFGVLFFVIVFFLPVFLIYMCYKMSTRDRVPGESFFDWTAMTRAVDALAPAGMANEFRPTGLTEAQLARLRVTYYKVGVTELFNKECTICRCPYEQDDAILRLPECGHCTHDECGKAWYKKNGTCCMCRKAVEPQLNKYENSEYTEMH